MASGRIHSRFGHDCKGFAKDEEVARISKAVVEMANNFNLGVDEDDIEEHLEEVPQRLTDGVDEDDIEEHLEEVPQRLTDEELLELKQENTAAEKASEKEAKGEEKEENPLRKFTVKGLAEAFADLNKLLTKLENMDPEHRKVVFN